MTVKFTTPKGELEWVTIDGEGKENLSGTMQYVANVVLPADSPVVAKIEKFWEDNKPSGFSKPCKSNGIYKHKGDTGEKDAAGKAIYDEDGKIVLSFKTGTTWPDGKTKKIQVYNAKAQKVVLPEGVSIGNGTIGSIGGAMAVYKNTAKTGKVLDAGVTLYLDAVQISKLVEFTQDAGFAVDEDAGEDAWTGDEGWTGSEEESEAKPRL